MEVLFFQGDGRLLVQGGVKRPNLGNLINTREFEMDYFCVIFYICTYIYIYIIYMKIYIPNINIYMHFICILHSAHIYVHV